MYVLEISELLHLIISGGMDPFIKIVNSIIIDLSYMSIPLEVLLPMESIYLFYQEKQSKCSKKYTYYKYNYSHL